MSDRDVKRQLDEYESKAGIGPLEGARPLTDKEVADIWDAFIVDERRRLLRAAVGERVSIEPALFRTFSELRVAPNGEYFRRVVRVAIGRELGLEVAGAGVPRAGFRSLGGGRGSRVLTLLDRALEDEKGATVFYGQLALELERSGFPVEASLVTAIAEDEARHRRVLEEVVEKVRGLR